MDAAFIVACSKGGVKCRQDFRIDRIYSANLVILSKTPLKTTQAKGIEKDTEREHGDEEVVFEWQIQLETALSVFRS